MKTDVSIKGLQHIQADALRIVAELQPDGALGEAVRYATTAVHRYVTANTVVDTGSWRASHRPEVRGLRGRVFIDPNAVNPRSSERPIDYGTRLELERGGRYAPYRTVYEQAGPDIVQQAGEIVRQRLP